MENEWFSKLTEEQKAKLSKLEGGTEALIAFCREEKLDLPDDLLEVVSGGTTGNILKY
jgi:hypothetical protein